MTDALAETGRVRRNGNGAAARSLYRGEHRLREILDAADAAFVSVDREGLIVDWSARAEEIFGWPRREALGCSLTNVVHPVRAQTGASCNLAEVVEDDEVELRLRRRDGSEFPALITVLRVPAGDDCIFHAFVRDLTEQRHAEERRRDAERRLAHQTLHDPPTGLPNRALIAQHLDHTLQLARRGDTAPAVLSVSVDNFGAVADSLGTHGGDQLLLAIAARLRGALLTDGTIAYGRENALGHLGGGAFAIVYEDVAAPEDALAAAERVAGVMAPAFEVVGEAVYVSVSSGIALAGLDASADTLLRDAGIARHEAQTLGRDRHVLFDPEMLGRARERVSGEAELRRAIQRRELRIHYQPIVSVSDCGLVGAEALVRWEHPERGLLAPAEFLPLAERTGLIVPLGQWVLEEAIAQAATWQREYDSPLRLSVNVSGHQLVRPDTVDEILALLDATGLAPCRLALEITETVLLDQLEAPVDALRRLQDLGVRILLDDFGTGFSSLTYLRRLPLDALKLDRSFVSELDETAADRQIVAAVIQLSRALTMGTIAEGVETESQLACLRELGCHLAQGYLFARPMPPDQFSAILEESRGD
jgi:PAS domain S-box-containing protein/diguanylate cyclase (GGDEF)-like protein